MDKTYLVYKHIFPNGKVYIGITSRTAKARWKNGTGYHKEQPLINSAIQKYGWKNVKHEILYDGLTKEQACEKEIELIALYKSNRKEYGYNISRGGEGSFSITDETRQRMSEAHKGKTLTEAQRMKIGVANREYWARHKKVQPDGASKKCWDKRRENGTDIAWNKGTVATYDYMICQYDKNGVEVNRFPNGRQAYKTTGIRHIADCYNGKRKTAGGFVWKRVSIS